MKQKGKIGSVEFLFPWYEIQDAGTNEGGDSACPPHTAPELSDDDVAPLRELLHWGSHSGGGETPLERLACNWAFLQSRFPGKLSYSGMIQYFSPTPPFAMIAATLEGSLPWRIMTKQSKKTLPAVPRSGPEAGFHRIYNTIFMVREWTPEIHVCFSRVKKQILPDREKLLHWIYEKHGKFDQDMDRGMSRLFVWNKNLGYENCSILPGIIALIMSIYRYY